MSTELTRPWWRQQWLRQCTEQWRCQYDDNENFEYDEDEDEKNENATTLMSTADDDIVDDTEIKLKQAWYRH